ncbi:unnamed protein product [Brugia pahangi]|uniref:Uncharacterized protein n=1 Tax=Brugia pahangi TaxID=6280 RepID=A0A0N4TCZ0_BRUPA|nr:unnamed protein product [Brugia pahangi]
MNCADRISFICILQYCPTDPPRVPALLSDEHSADETVLLPECSPTKRVMVSSTPVAGKPSRHRVRKESGKSAAPVKSPPHKTGSGNTSDTEWMKATSRRSAGKTVMSGKSAASGTTSKEDSASNTVPWRHVDLVKHIHLVEEIEFFESFKI